MNFLKKIFKIKNLIEKVSSIDSRTPLQLEDLHVNEREYIQSYQELALKILEALEIKQKTHRFEPHRIEAGIKAWFDTDLGSKFSIDINTYSNILATAWGKYLEEVCQLSWHVITDEFGTEIGLYHPKNDITVFPYQSTAKAFTNKYYTLLSTITTKIDTLIQTNQFDIEHLNKKESLEPEMVGRNSDHFYVLKNRSGFPPQCTTSKDLARSLISLANLLLAVW